MRYIANKTKKPNKRISNTPSSGLSLTREMVNLR